MCTHKVALLQHAKAVSMGLADAGTACSAVTFRLADDAAHMHAACTAELPCLNAFWVSQTNFAIHGRETSQGQHTRSAPYA